ncbi:MAG: hypothetical protein IKH16_13350 [Selenomonadaceae bacterium]|nr:hypothetical protein [Selenomonadaceae bacterium]
MNGTRSYQTEIIFNGPTFQSNITGVAQVDENGFSLMHGDIQWMYTNLNTNQTKTCEVPFFAERSGNSMTLYGMRNGSWQRESMLGSLTWLLDMMAEDNRELRAQYAAAVTSVKTKDEGRNRLSMQIRFNGKALSETKDRAVRESIASLPEEEQGPALAAVRYFNAALAENTPELTWTIDRTTGETVTVAADLTDIMRSYAKAVLEDSYQGRISLTPEETELLASFGYYYHLQLYLTRNDKNAGRLAIPADVRSSARESAFLHDMEMDVVSVVKK